MTKHCDRIREVIMEMRKVRRNWDRLELDEEIQKHIIGGKRGYGRIEATRSQIGRILGEFPIERRRVGRREEVLFL